MTKSIQQYKIISLVYILSSILVKLATILASLQHGHLGPQVLLNVMCQLCKYIVQLYVVSYQLVSHPFHKSPPHDAPHPMPS
jgi:hypothetical protein